MLAAIPLPYRILIIVALLLGTFAAGYAEGIKTAKDHAAAQQLVAAIKSAEAFRLEVERGNALSGQLASAETALHAQTTERMRHVQNVTTGRDCLSPDAVRLLNGTGKLTLRETASQPPAESPGEPAATDADVEAWAIQASDQYRTCAYRLNGLIDYEQGRP